MLDGFPRTTTQAQDLDRILEKARLPIDHVLCLESTTPVIIKRLTGRRICRKCGAVYHATNRPSRVANVCDVCSGELYQRTDDHEDTIRTRMQVYLTNTLPIVEYYEAQGKLQKLNGDNESEDLHEILKQALKEDGKLHSH